MILVIFIKAVAELGVIPYTHLFIILKKQKKRKQTFIQIEMASKLKLNNILRHYTLKQAEVKLNKLPHRY